MRPATGLLLAQDEFVPTLGTAPLLLIAVAAVALLLVLIMVLHLHAFPALILVSLLTALVAGIPASDAVTVVLEGFGTTLASVALLVGLGAMIGKLLEVTGGAQVLADSLVNRFGEKRAPFALGVASLLFGFPIFFDAGFVVFLPIIFSVARQFGGSVLVYALPSAGAFAVMHAFVPPHPGPVGAAGILGADIGLVLIVGVVLGLPTWYIASYLFGVWAGRRTHVPVPDLLGSDENGTAGADGAPVATDVRTAPPRFGTVLILLLLPLVLILLNTGLNTLATAGVVDGDTATIGALRLFGQTPVALLITLLVALVVLGRERFSRSEAEEIIGSALGPVCAIILITGAGGAFGGVLRTTGIGDALADSLNAIGLPVIVAAFLVALALRVAQGSATVALTTTAGLLAPVVAAEGTAPLDIAFIVIAIAAGSTALSHVNDSGFWLVGRFLNMDVKTTLRTWTVMETLIGLVGFALAFVASLLL